MAMAFFGPNSHILVSVGSDLWGEKMEDFTTFLESMIVLFGFDTVSMVLTSIILWKVIHLNMMSEFFTVIRKYWFFMAVQFGSLLATHLAPIDINFGNDVSAKYSWIHQEGWRGIIYNSTELNEEEKAALLVTNDLI